ncbi:MAG: RAMP superfamily CRISPR-associated protein [Abditibacteriales bacterium]|nr:RAMP superfamily CRISPR-associated protein [Abditibacteriales bacterium]
MRPQQPLPPKPFAWVDFLRTPDRSKPGGHDRWHGNYTGALDCTLTLLTPLHIGSGLFRLADGQVVKEAMRRGEQFVIPGSSLKGVFRSIAEAISHSCFSKTKQPLPSAALRECSDPKNLCVCCRLFGGLGYLGRVRFNDAVPADQAHQIYNVPPLWRPRRAQQGRKFYKHGQPATGKEPFEVLPNGTQFDFRVDVESLTPDEMCLLLTALGIVGDLKPKIGGGKPRCLGSAQVTLRQARFWSPQNAALEYERIESTLNADQLRAQVEKATNLIQQDALKKLQAILKHPQGTECPPELY